MPPVCRKTTVSSARIAPSRMWRIMRGHGLRGVAGIQQDRLAARQHRDRLEALRGRDAVALANELLIGDEIPELQPLGQAQEARGLVRNPLRALDLFRLAGADRHAVDRVRGAAELSRQASARPGFRAIRWRNTTWTERCPHRRAAPPAPRSRRCSRRRLRRSTRPRESRTARALRRVRRPRPRQRPLHPGRRRTSGRSTARAESTPRIACRAAGCRRSAARRSSR